ncbi:MAG: cupin domain-containing protein [Sulfuriferula sp.]|nr:cupin domain-containing protein [Sulfuriferula sp.]
MNKQLLGGISADVFLRDYWQKKPLLVRQAVPDFQGLISPATLFELASDEDAQARLVRQKASGWDLEFGPFAAKTFKPKRDKLPWTLLVQELNHYLPSGVALLQQFDFIPHARLDDLMVSYAPAGGGVGPHFDSYDVFLLQGMGHRRWQISAQDDLSLVEGAPLRILKNFQATEEWILAPGDMLYLPPQYAHNGIAEDECMTYSIGFRAPTTQEIATQFLVYMQDKLHIPGRYADADLVVQSNPAEMSEAMLAQWASMVAQVQWGQADIIDFAGRYLTEPKPHIFFQPPDEPLSMRIFVTEVKKQGVRLSPSSRMLFYQRQCYLNGDLVVSNADLDALIVLANQRELALPSWSNDLLEWLFECYLDGYVLVGMSAIK